MQTENQKIFAFHPTLKCGVCVDFWMLNVPHPHTKVCGFRHRHIDIRNFGIENNFNVLAENAVDKENVVRFAVISGTEIDVLVDFIREQFGDLKIENIAREIINPVLSNWKINDGKE